MKDCNSKFELIPLKSNMWYNSTLYSDLNIQLILDVVELFCIFYQMALSTN